MSKLVYALVGEDSFLQMQGLEEILASLPKGIDRIDIDGDRATLSGVLDELRSFAMFGGGKVVVIRQADEFLKAKTDEAGSEVEAGKREHMEKYVASPTDGVVLVMRFKSLPATQRIAKLIAKTGEIISCAPPKGQAVAGWIVKRAKAAHGATVNPDAASVLVDFLGDDLARIDSELAKLALMSDTGVIDAKLVSKSVVFQREQEMWHLTDELTAGRPTDALRRWRRLVQLDTSAEFRAVTWLCIWLEKLSRASSMRRDGAHPSAIARDLKIWPAHNVDAILRAADNMGESAVAHAVDLLADVDRRSKSGLGDAAENVERFIIDLDLKKRVVR